MISSRWARPARHHTFFEMLGNFSFGDYFKRDAVAFAWEFLNGDPGAGSPRLYVTVHESDDEAEQLWQEVAGVPLARIFRLGDRDNFWQMADTGPCGPCSELHYDVRPAEVRGAGPVDREIFVEAGERGEFLGALEPGLHAVRPGFRGHPPSPAGSLHRHGGGAGADCLGASGSRLHYHTDLFLPFWSGSRRWWGSPMRPPPPRDELPVLADHARAVAFLLADGVFPSNEGRG